ncbi:MAG: thioredoxin fold domain-containing protein [Rhodoplanes sp.]|uniref:thioredoxin family protein n=1 Tax=Rhodoplanes sp. TaxID=1968906 RepID=UPI0017946877|nr:thioredoxin family protein [Rhodoplanes sp.]NVO13154.1 thioredoxin fold domain-containing protein [Rhodoplanes sp.]
MLSRRLLLAAALAGSGLAGRPGFAEELTLGEDGLPHVEWFLQSLLELADDVTLAGQNGKRLAVMWELRGCPYCRETHVKNLGDPAISGYIREHFEVLQLNITGARTVVDFDGEKLTEKALADKYGVRFTPTFQFFGESADAMKAKKPRDREVARAQGYLEPKHFVALFRFVADKAYEKGSLRDYLRTQGA